MNNNAEKKESNVALPFVPVVEICLNVRSDYLADSLINNKNHPGHIYNIATDLSKESPISTSKIKPKSVFGRTTENIEEEGRPLPTDGKGKHGANKYYDLNKASPFVGFKPLSNDRSTTGNKMVAPKKKADQKKIGLVSEEIVIEEDNPQSGVPSSSMGRQVNSTKKSSFCYTFGKKTSISNQSRSYLKDREFEKDINYSHEVDAHALETPFFIKTQQVLSTQKNPSIEAFGRSTAPRFGGDRGRTVNYEIPRSYTDISKRYKSNDKFIRAESDISLRSPSMEGKILNSPNNNSKSVQYLKGIDFHQMRVGPGSYNIGSSMGQQVSSLKRSASAPSFGIGQRLDIRTGYPIRREPSPNKIKILDRTLPAQMEEKLSTSNLNTVRRQQIYDIKLNTTSSRFNKATKSSSPGPGAYELPSTIQSSSPVSTIKSIRSPTLGPR